ncbi:unnamed protein product [Trifolium pratense]|uniref:Uncharacterized protein n=1 Tax=Trifolium pratense TaxID=57577 RepID=A0ACB0IX21_TRIPR|nr:unnamed protein product [Trifolium pratense]
MFLGVYDQLISTHPNDFCGYLAKGASVLNFGTVAMLIGHRKACFELLFDRVDNNEPMIFLQL